MLRESARGRALREATLMLTNDDVIMSNVEFVQDLSKEFKGVEQVVIWST